MLIVVELVIMLMLMLVIVLVTTVVIIIVVDRYFFSLSQLPSRAIGSAYPFPKTKRDSLPTNSLATLLHLSLVVSAMPNEMGNLCNDSSISVFKCDS